MKRNMNREMTIFWSLYDFATTPVAFAINAMYLPLMIVEAGGSSSTVGILPLITGAIAGIWTPIVGTVIDRSRQKSLVRKIVVIVSVTLAGASIVALSMVQGLLQIIMLFIVMTLGIQTGWTAMNAYLAQEGYEERMGTTSGAGVTVGYLGGAIGAGGAVILERLLGRAAAMIFIGGMLMAFGMLSVSRLREQERLPSSSESLSESLRKGLNAVSNNTSVKAYLIGTILWGDAIATIVTFASLLSQQVLHIPEEHIIGLLAIAVPCALVGAIVHGRLGDRLGIVRLLGANLFIWMGGITTLIVFGSAIPPVLVGIVAGFALGGTMTLSRALYARIIPDGMEARLFGVAAIFTFFGGSIGPLLTGVMSDLPGMSLRTALIIPLIFLLLGLPTLHYIRINSGPFQEQN